jgi:hypothetical protein
MAAIVAARPVLVTIHYIAVSTRKRLVWFLDRTYGAPRRAHEARFVHKSPDDMDVSAG